MSPSTKAQDLRSNSDKATIAVFTPLRAFLWRTQEIVGFLGPPSPDLATKHHQSGPPHGPSEFRVCPLFASLCLHQRSSIGRGALSPICSIAADRKDHDSWEHSTLQVSFRCTCNLESVAIHMKWPRLACARIKRKNRTKHIGHTWLHNIADAVFFSFHFLIELLRQEETSFLWV